MTSSSGKTKRWLIILGAFFGSLLFIFAMILGVAYYRQDSMVSDLVSRMNQQFSGRLEIQGSHIAPFESFPYISIDLEDLQIFESKSPDAELLLHVTDAYIGFDIRDIISGNMAVKHIKLNEGFLKLIQHTDGTFNIARVLQGDSTENPPSEESLDFQLDKVVFKNIDLLKFNEENKVLIEAYIEDAISSFSTSTDSIDIALESRFLFNLVLDQDTSFLHDKQIQLKTRLSFDIHKNTLNISPSEVLIEKALFSMNGSVDFANNMDLDLKFEGRKPDFDLFLAFAPPELAPAFQRYDNGGQIYFDAVIKGPSINGHSPKIDIDFGCAEAFVQNVDVNKAVNDLYFKGHFTNGALRNPSTMSLSIVDFSARPETGIFKGSLLVNNFDSPEIDMQITCDFDLDFLAKFLNLSNLKDVTGYVSLEMNFHDIIDIQNPEKSIEKLNESYFTALEVKDLNFASTDYSLPVTDVNISATMDGHKAIISRLDFKVGKSDIAITASVSDLPAILHHTFDPVEAELIIRSSLLDLYELTGSDSLAFNDQIQDLRLGLQFKSSARAFTESPNLPLGEFFVKDLHAQFVRYPHELHDFHADILIDSTDFKVIDFTGMIDESDFHFNGTLAHYDLWFEEAPTGATSIDFSLTSELVQLEDLFSYGGENYVPEDYRHEEFRNLYIHGMAHLEFDKKLIRSDITIDKLTASMKVHSMSFEDFGGRFLIDSTRIEVQNLRGRLGNSDFKANMKYFWKENKEHPHTLAIHSKRLDFDQLFAYNPSPPGTAVTVQHDSAFNIFDLPFSDFHISFQADKLNYHRIVASNFNMNARLQKDHYLYLDTLSFDAAGGHMAMNGYFNGSNPDSIYVSPNILLDNVDIDQLMFKFENFGQEYLVSENLHGKVTGSIQGKIHVYPDLMPIMDDSEVHMDFAVINGSLTNYSVFHAMSDYFSDKNLDLVRFDTLKNSLDLKNGKLTMPAMNINSSLGYFEVSGTQNYNMEMEYYVRIPWKVVTQVGFNKLFGKKDQNTTGQVDDIQYRDENKRTRFVNLKIEGTPDDYRISLGRDKSK
jgi:hypothetical protein